MLFYPPLLPRVEREFRAKTFIVSVFIHLMIFGLFVAMLFFLGRPQFKLQCGHFLCVGQRSRVLFCKRSSC